MINIDMHAKTQIILRTLSASARAANSAKLALITWLRPFWRKKLNSQQPQPLLSADEIEVRIWAFVVVIVTFILFFIVVALIWRTTFVVQPIKQISPMDMADQKMLNDIVLLIVGGIGGVMTRKGIRNAAEMIAAVKAPPTPAMPQMPMYGMQPGMMPYAAPQAFAQPQAFTQPPVQFADWTPPPPPQTPPYLESDEERERMAAARREAV
jgi:hypothetical protein